MRGYFQQGLQHAFDLFCSVCDQAETTISAKRLRYCVSQGAKRQCFLQLNGNTLQQVKTFKYLGVVFTSDESPNKGIDRRIGKTNAVLRKFLMQVGNCQVLYKKYSRRLLSFNLRDQNPLHENNISSRSNSRFDDAKIKSINRCRVFAENLGISLN